MDVTAAVPSRGGDEGARQAVAPDAEDEGQLSADELFHLLQNPRRRAVIRHLRGRESPQEVGDVADQVAAWEEDTTVAQLSYDERRRVYVSLYQHHLDTLADAGLIEYDRRRGKITPRPLLEDVAAYLERGPQRTDASTGALGYLGLSLVATLLLLGTALDLAVVEPLSAFAATGLILLLFTALAVTRFALTGRGRA